MTVFNNPPVGEDDFNNTIVDTPVEGNVLTNDDDPDTDDTLMVVDVNGDPVGTPVETENGTIVVQPDGSYEYTPDPGFVGTETVTFTVTDEAGNEVETSLTLEVRDSDTDPSTTPPIANDDSWTVFEGGTASGSLISNDGDPTNQAITINTTPVSPPQNGTVTIQPDGTYVYVPNPGYIGTDTFEYEIVDPDGNIDTAMVSITVIPDANGPGNDAPYAGDDAALTTKNVPATGDLLANDSEPNGDPITINTTPVSGPTNGTLVINPDGTFTYTPNSGFEGTDSFEYEICDDLGECTTATAYVTVFNQPPVAEDIEFELTSLDPFTENAMQNDSDPDGDPLSGSVVSPPTHGTVTWQADGTFTYTPGATFAGDDSFTYETCDDSGACRTATVSLVLPFAFDSLTNESSRNPFRDLAQQDGWNSRPLMTERIHGIASEPIMAGYATPGTILAGKVYDTSGAIVGEASAQVNRAGNWVMNFFGTTTQPGYYVVIEHVLQSGNDAEFNFRLTEDTYRSFQLGQVNKGVPTPGSILADSPHESLNALHLWSTNPLNLLD